MELKKQFVDQVLSEMSCHMSREEIERLNNVMLSKLRDVDMVMSETSVAVCNNSNEKYLRMFVASRLLEGLSKNTLRQYVFYSRNFLDWIRKDFVDITSIDVQYYLSEYERTHNVCKCSLDNMRKGINGFFLWLFENDYIESNPVAKIKHIAYEKKTIETLTDEEILDIRDYIHDDYRTRAIVEVLLSTGVRVSELCNIMIKDVDLDNSEIVIHCAKKRNKQDRVLFLTAEAKKAINNYIDYRDARGWNDSPYLFVSNRKYGRPLSERLVNEKLHAIETALDLKKNLTVHMFRKTLASILYKRGMSPLDIAYILGHVDTRMSETYYINVKNEDVCRNYRRFR